MKSWIRDIYAGIDGDGLAGLQKSDKEHSIYNIICEAASPNMLQNLKMIFFCIFENVDDLASKCKKNYAAATEIGKVMKNYVQKG